MKYIFPFGCYLIGTTLLSSANMDLTTLIGLSLFVYGMVSAYNKLDKEEEKKK